MLNSAVRLNAEKDPNYCPYCMRCKGLVRMKKQAHMLWNCKCGAVHDERLFMAYNHNGTKLMKKPASKLAAEVELREYKKQTGNDGYVEEVER
jgi:hypothetical protein